MRPLQPGSRAKSVTGSVVTLAGPWDSGHAMRRWLGEKSSRRIQRSLQFLPGLEDLGLQEGDKARSPGTFPGTKSEAPHQGGAVTDPNFQVSSPSHPEPASPARSA